MGSMTIVNDISNNRVGILKMMTLGQIQKHLEDRRKDVVSEATGIHRNTLWLIQTGRSDNPSYKIVKALSDYFSAEVQE